MQSLSCHVKYLCRTSHSKKTTYEQTFFSVSSDFSTRAILTFKLPNCFQLLHPYAHRASLARWTRIWIRQHLFPKYQPSNLCHDEAQGVEGPGSNNWRWVYIPGYLVGNESWVAGRMQNGRQIVQSRHCAASLKLEGGGAHWTWRRTNLCRTSLTTRPTRRQWLAPASI